MLKGLSMEESLAAGSLRGEASERGSVTVSVRSFIQVIHDGCMSFRSPFAARNSIRRPVKGCSPSAKPFQTLSSECQSSNCPRFS